VFKIAVRRKRNTKIRVIIKTVFSVPLLENKGPSLVKELLNPPLPDWSKTAVIKSPEIKICNQKTNLSIFIYLARIKMILSN